jgi:hypothetical protein
VNNRAGSTVPRLLFTTSLGAPSGLPVEHSLAWARVTDPGGRGGAWTGEDGAWAGEGAAGVDVLVLVLMSSSQYTQ